MKRATMTLAVLLMALTAVFSFTANSDAMMGGGPGMTGSPMITNNGGFGMMNGMTGAPVIGEDGTAYLVSYNPTSNPGTVPNSNSFESKIMAVTPSGQITSITVKGIVSKPVVGSNFLVATASLPDFGNYNLVGNFGNNPAGGQSVIYIMSLPFAATTLPDAVSMDGSYASIPVITNDKVYVTTTNFGNAMMGSTTFNMFGNGNYNFNQNGLAKTYLYIFNFDGSLVSKVEIQ